MVGNAVARNLSGRFASLLRRVPVGPDGVARIGGRQIYIIPTATGAWYGGAVLLILVGSLNYQNNLGLLLAFFLAGVGIAAMHHCWFNLLGLAVSARPGVAVFAGGWAGFQVTLRNERGRPRFDLRIGAGAEKSGPVFLEESGSGVLELVRQTQSRGWLELGEVMVETRHPMHLFRAWCYASAQAAVLVYPRPAGSAPVPEGHGSGEEPAAATAGEGRDDYLGPRPYRPGDPLRRLDWKALARERGLVVKEFSGEQGRDLWIDWDRVPPCDDESRLGYLTRQVMVVAREDRRFGLRLPGVELGMGRGEAHCQACLKALALWHPGGRGTHKAGGDARVGI